VYKAPIYHKIKVANLEGSTFKGKFFEVTIQKIRTNERFECPQVSSRCYTPYMCELKVNVMNRPVKSHLICTIVVVSIKNISSRVLRFRTGCQDGGYCHIIDSNGEFYKTTYYGHDGYDSQCWCEFRITKQKYMHTHVKSENIPSNAKATFLLYFPEVAEEVTIERLIIAGTSQTQEWNEKIDENPVFLETFDFEKSEEIGSKTFTR